MPRGGAISQTERVRLAEDVVLKTVAPAMVSKVRLRASLGTLVANFLGRLALKRRGNPADQMSVWINLKR
jgi:hypothetical protein